MKSKIFSSKYLKIVSRGKGWIPGFLSLGCLLAFPVMGLLMLGNWRGLDYTSYQISLLYENLWKDGFLFTGGIVAILAGVLNGINGFLYLHSRKQTDFYHSLPVKRSGMFLSRFFTGLVYYLVPYVIMEFFTVCIGAARGFFSLKLMGAALTLLLLHLLVYLMIYFCVVLVFCITGNILMGACCLLVIWLYGPVLSFLLTGYRYVFYDTFSTGFSYGLIRFLREAASPIVLAAEFFDSYGQGGGRLALAGMIFLTVVFAVLSYFAYVRRASEAAQKPMVYPKAAFVLKFMVVVPAGLAVGYIFYLLPTSSMRIIWWGFGLLLGTILAHGLMEVIYGMDFHCFFRKKLQLLLAGILVAFCAFVYQTDLFHYDEYLPPKEEFAALGFAGAQSEFWGIQDGQEIIPLSDGTFRAAEYDSWKQMCFSETEEAGEKTYEVLREIAGKQEMRSPKRQMLGDQTADILDDEYMFSTDLKFVLESGREICREYYFTSQEAKDLLSTLYEETDLKENREQILDAEYIDVINLFSEEGKIYSIFQDAPEKREELLKAFEKDIQAADTEELLQAPCCRLQINYTLPGAMDINQMIPGGKNPEIGVYYNYNIYPSYKNTMAVLKQTGYPITLEEITVEKITVDYYNKAGKKVKTADYTKPEQIQAILEAAAPNSIDYWWLDYFRGLGVSFQTKDTYDDVYIQLLSDQVPDFILEEMEELEEISETGGVDGPTSVYIKSETGEAADE